MPLLAITLDNIITELLAQPKIDKRLLARFQPAWGRIFFSFFWPGFTQLTRFDQQELITAAWAQQTMSLMSSLAPFQKGGTQLVRPEFDCLAATNVVWVQQTELDL